jgi:hypothetical protein
MGLIREPLDVDFYVDPTPLTKKEKEAISKYIREYKAKHAVKKSKAKPVDTPSHKRKQLV